MKHRNIGKLFAAMMIVLCLPLAGCSSPAPSAGPRKAASSQSATPKKETVKQKNSAGTKTKTPAPAKQDKPKTSDEILAEVNSLSPAAASSAWDTSTGYLNVPHSDMKSVFVGCSPKFAYSGHEWEIAADGSWLRSQEKDMNSASSPFAASNPGIPSFLLTSCLANFAGMPDAAIKAVSTHGTDGQWHSVTWDGHELLFTGTTTSYDFVLK